MFRCRGRPQLALETGIHGIFASIDKDKGLEFKQLITQLHGRLPAGSKSEPKVPVETPGHFGKLLNTLTSARCVSSQKTQRIRIRLHGVIMQKHDIDGGARKKQGRPLRQADATAASSTCGAMIPRALRRP